MCENNAITKYVNDVLPIVKRRCFASTNISSTIISLPSYKKRKRAKALVLDTTKATVAVVVEVAIARVVVETISNTTIVVDLVERATPQHTA
jgi:hypothetical protein